MKDMDKSLLTSLEYQPYNLKSSNPDILNQLISKSPDYSNARMSLAKLNKKIDELDSLIAQSNSLNINNNQNLKNEMNIRREEIKSLIDLYYDEMIKQLCSNSEAKNGMTDDLFLKELKTKRESFSRDLSNSSFNDKYWKKLNNDIVEYINQADKEIDKIQQKILINSTVSNTLKESTQTNNYALKSDIIDKISKMSISNENLHISFDYHDSLVSSSDSEIIIWKPNTSETQKSWIIPNKNNKFKSFVVFSNQHIIASLSDNIVLLSIVDSIKIEKTYKQESSCLVTVNQAEFLSGSEDGCIYLWDIHDNSNFKKKFEKHLGVVTCLDVIPEDNRFISGSSDKTIKIWDLDSFNCLNTLDGHADLIVSVKVAYESNKIVSCAYDQSVIVWDLNKADGVVLEQKSWPFCIELLPNNRLAVGLSSGTLAIWDLDQNTCVKEFPQAHKLSITKLKYLPIKNRLASCSMDGQIHIWNSNHFIKVFTLDKHTNPVWFLDVI